MTTSWKANTRLRFRLLAFRSPALNARVATLRLVDCINVIGVSRTQGNHVHANAPSFGFSTNPVLGLVAAQPGDTLDVSPIRLRFLGAFENMRGDATFL